MSKKALFYSLVICIDSNLQTVSTVNGVCRAGAGSIGCRAPGQVWWRRRQKIKPQKLNKLEKLKPFNLRRNSQSRPVGMKSLHEGARPPREQRHSTDMAALASINAGSPRKAAQLELCMLEPRWAEHAQSFETAERSVWAARLLIMEKPEEDLSKLFKAGEDNKSRVL